MASIKVLLFVGIATFCILAVSAIPEGHTQHKKGETQHKSDNKHESPPPAGSDSDKQSKQFHTDGIFSFLIPEGFQRVLQNLIHGVRQAVEGLASFLNIPKSTIDPILDAIENNLPLITITAPLWFPIFIFTLPITTPLVITWIIFQQFSHV